MGYDVSVGQEKQMYYVTQGEGVKYRKPKKHGQDQNTWQNKPGYCKDFG